MAQEKVAKYEAFVNNRIKPDLLRAMSKRDKVLEQQQTFSDLTKNVQMLQQNSLKKLRTMINLGSEVYAQAEVPDTSHIFVEVGLGFYVEFSLQEALQFISHKQKLLTREASSQTQQIASIKAQIKLVLEGIRELMNIPPGE